MSMSGPSTDASTVSVAPPTSWVFAETVTVCSSAENENLMGVCAWARSETRLMAVVSAAEFTLMATSCSEGMSLL